MSKLFEEMMQGTAEAIAFVKGARKGYRVTLPEQVNVKKIRNSLHLSQTRFADSFGLSVDSVRHWEAGRRTPEASARALLAVIEHNPQAVIQAMLQASGSAGAQAGMLQVSKKRARPAKASPARAAR